MLHWEVATRTSVERAGITVTDCHAHAPLLLLAGPHTEPRMACMPASCGQSVSRMNQVAQADARSGGGSGGAPDGAFSVHVSLARPCTAKWRLKTAAQAPCACTASRVQCVIKLRCLGWSNPSYDKRQTMKKWLTRLRAGGLQPVPRHSCCVPACSFGLCGKHNIPRSIQRPSLSTLIIQYNPSAPIHPLPTPRPAPRAKPLTRRSKMAALLVPKPGGLVLHGARQPPAAAPAPRNAAPALARDRKSVV